MTDSLWRWNNSINLWVNEQDINREIKIAELFALDSTDSVHHFFGTGSKHYPIKGMVVGVSDRDSLDADAIANTSRSLVTPYETISGLRIKSIKFTISPHASLVIGGTTYDASVTPFYNFEAELYA